VADAAGQRTQMASLVNAVFILLTMLFLAGLFEDLASAVLGAVVIDAALGLIHFKVAKHFMVSRRDFAIFVVTAFGLFFIGVVAGIVLGLIVSLLLLIQRASKTPFRRMAYDPADQVYVEADTNPDATTVDGVLVLKVNGPLFFADVESFRTALLNLVSTSDVTAVVIDLEATPEMDLDGADMLTEVHEKLTDRGIRLLLTHADEDELELMRRAGTMDAIGEHNLFPTVRAAVAAT
jgi:MFS superfamily sulfate permease-like transporter